jgi:hypothetical protein
MLDNASERATNARTASGTNRCIMPRLSAI